MAKENKPEKWLSKNKKDSNAYMKYSVLGFQMAAIIGIFAFAGVKLDELLNCDPVFTVILSLSGVGLSLYYFIKKLITEDDSSSNQQP